MTSEHRAAGEAAQAAALALLRRFAGALDWRASQRTPEGDWRDLTVDIVGSDASGERFGVALKRLHGSNRVGHLQGAAAMAVLELQRARPDLRKLVWLHVDRIGALVISRLEAYLSEVAPDVAWAVVDSHGGAHISIPEFELSVDLSPDQAPPSTSKTQTTLFSDLNAWMLKLLLLRNAPAWAWTATREPCRNARALHFVAGVSGATAHRFVKAMHEADYLRSTRAGLRLVRVESLLRSWRAAYQSQPSVMIGARPLFELDDGALTDTVLGGRSAIGGQLAAAHFGLQHATRGRRTIWVEADPRAALDALDLVPAEPGRATVWVGQPRHVESCFRARVTNDGAAFVDPCELMLESSTDPARGFEQSEYLLQRILAWQEDA